MSSARWDKIKVPLYSVGNWSGIGLHLRGNIEGYMNAASKHKKLRIHSGTHFHPFHSEEGRIDQLRLFDHWLKGIDTGIMDEPPVKLEIRTGGSTKPLPVPLRERVAARAHGVDEVVSQGRLRAGAERAGDGRRARRRAAAGSREVHLRGEPALARRRELVRAVARRRAAWTAPASPSRRAPMAEDTEITGPMVLILWVSSTSEDMDIFATIRNIGPDGKDVWEVGPAGRDAMPVRDQGLAARLAPQARPGEVAAVPSVSRAQRAASG